MANHKPVYRCEATINGPKVARHVVLWRKFCQNRVKSADERCHLHRKNR